MYIEGWNGAGENNQGGGMDIEEIRMFNLAAGIERKLIKKK